MEKAIIIIGDPIDGYGFFGPFESHEEAIEFAEKAKLDSWYVASLESPDNLI